MKRSGIGFTILAFCLLVTATGLVWGAEKVRFGDSVKFSPTGRIPFEAAEEKGFWTKNGLDAERLAFGGGQANMQAVAAGAVDTGWSTNATIFRAASAGVPIIIVGDLLPVNDFSVWVSTKSKFKNPNDIRGIKLGVGGRGGVEYIYGSIVTKAMGQRKEAKFVLTGGIRASLAALRGGHVDGVILTPRQMWDMKLRGEVLELIPVSKYLPKPWLEHVLYARKGFAQSNPEGVKRTVRAIVQATNFIRDNRGWTIAKMREIYRYSQATAEKVYDEGILYTRTGRLNMEAVRNVRKLLVDFDVISADKAPSPEAAATNKYVD
jgi:ABC-type nitrate/sulfonate/bicarbonate transport system substrate-binding protein